MFIELDIPFIAIPALSEMSVISLKAKEHLRISFYKYLVPNGTMSRVIQLWALRFYLSPNPDSFDIHELANSKLAQLAAIA